MKKLTKLVILLPIAAVLLTACVATTYKVSNATYNNREEAMAATLREYSEAESAVTAGTNALVDRKLLVVSPTAAAYSRTFEALVMKQGKQYATPGTPARAQDDFTADATVANVKSVAASIRKSNIYREVEVLDVDTTSPNIQPSPTQDVLILNYLGADSGVRMDYFFSARFGKQILAVDMGRATRAERRKSLIDEVKAKALQ